MGLYSEAILRQLGQVGKPLTQTSVTTEEGTGQGLDLPSLLMMLYYSGIFGGNKKKADATSSLGTFGQATAPATPMAIGGFGSTPGSAPLVNRPQPQGGLPNDFTLEMLYRMLGGK